MKNIILIGMPGTARAQMASSWPSAWALAFWTVTSSSPSGKAAHCPEILETDGLEHFLVLEGQAGESIQCEKTVIATGGSMIFSPKAMDHLKQNSLTIWLDTPVSELEKRLSAGSRHDRGVAAPAELSIAEIYAQREALYAKYADHRILCELGTDRVVAQIQDLLDGLREAGAR